MASSKRWSPTAPREPLPATTMLVPAEVAFLTRLSVSTLAKMRLDGRGPKWYRPAPGIVRYLRTDVEEWLRAGGAVRTTAEADARDREAVA